MEWVKLNLEWFGMYIKKNLAGYVLIAIGMAFVGCGDDSSSEAEYEFEVVGDSASSSLVDRADSLANAVTESSSDFQVPSSSSAVLFDSAYFGGYSTTEIEVSSGAIEGLSSSSSVQPRSSAEPPFSSAMEPPHSSGVQPRSSAEPPLSSAMEPPRSSSSVPVFSDKYLVGADISKVQEHEAYGVRFFDTDGKENDIFSILRNHGFNAVRLKTFVSPKTQYGYAASGCGQDTEAFGDKEHVIAYAKKVKTAGMYFLLDIHYSDNWADPGKQIIPERWRGIGSSDVMADSVYAYTFDLVNALKQAGATPDMVQVGNEITNGLLRDVPNSNTDCWGNNVNTANASVSGILSNDAGRANTAKYLKAGVRAVKAVSNNIKTAFHIENPEKTSTVEWWMDLIFKKQGVTADAMGISAYTAYDDGNPSTWKTLLTNLGKTYTDLEFFIAEYNGGEKDNSYSYSGARAQTQRMMEEVPRGLGAFFWEPTEGGAWGPSMFKWNGKNELHALPEAFDEYDKGGFKK